MKDKEQNTRRILAAEILTTHGLKGLVKLRPFVESLSLLEGTPLFTAQADASTLKISLKNPMKDCILAAIEGVEDRTKAETFRGTQLYIERSALPPTENGEYYVEDLKGLHAVSPEGAEIGTVLNVVNYGAGDLLEINPHDGGVSFYLPFTGETIVAVDLPAERITLLIPEAL